MTNPFDFFQRKICLSLHDSEYQLACAEFHRVNLTGVEKFQALPIDTDQILGPHQSFNGSTNRILREFYESGAETLLFLEDDCQFRDLSHLGEALGELPPTWDICYLGANLVMWNRGDEPQPEPFSKHLFRVKAAWTTHAVAYNRKVVPFLLENQPGFSVQMFDNWMSEQLPNLNAFVVTPMVAWQRTRWSEIWKRDVDYNDVFRLSDERLMAEYCIS